jgi:uncharacterized membrane protein/mono/diheme cytochrome c family protein
MDVRALGVRVGLPSLIVAGLIATASPLMASVPPLPATRAMTPVPSGGHAAPAETTAPPRAAQAPEPAAPSPGARPWWGWLLLGRLHPIVVHFPIALLTVAAAIEGLHLLRRRPVPSEAGTYCLAFGVAGAIVSVWFGTLNAGHQSVTGDAAVAVERHQVMGGLPWPGPPPAWAAGRGARPAAGVRQVAAYVVLVLATSAVVGATGHLGGGLVYGEDYLTGLLPWKQKAAPVSAEAPAVPVAAAPASVVAPLAAPVPAMAPTATPAAAHVREMAPAAAPSAPAPIDAAEAQAAAAPDFTREVMPIFKRTCVECHGPDKVKARLRMDSVEALQKGGKSGALLKPGDAENSLIMRRVLGLDGEDQMPLDKDPLTEKQIDTLRRWIAAGAPYPAAGSQ